MSKAITRLLRHDQTVLRGSEGAIQYDDIIEESRKKKFDRASQWPLEDWISTLEKGRGGAKKKLKQFLCLRAIQGHSGDNAIDPELQENILLPKRFTEYIYHVGNANELNSKCINSRRKQPQKRKTNGVLHYSEPDGGRIWHGGNSTRSDETKDRAMQEYLEMPSKDRMLVQFEARSRERSAIFSNEVTCSRSLQQTTCSLY